MTDAVSQPTAAHAADPTMVNPMTVNGGFTVYSRGDATLSNSETEGSIAVGGQLTMGTSATYQIAHRVAGTGAYIPPTIDSDPTRLLVGTYNPNAAQNPGRINITNVGATEPSQYGDLKVVQRNTPFVTYQRGSWLRYGISAGSDTPPLIDATNQVYPANAAPPTTSAGNGSVFTYNTTSVGTSTADVVADYVGANAQASMDQITQCLDQVTVPSGPGHQLTAVAYGTRYVLSALQPGVPNYIDYADIAGATLIQFSSTVPDATTPLIIVVPAGTSDIPGPQIDPEGTYSPFVLWDASSVTGPLNVHSGSRIDGSIYAPNADLTITAAPWDGQVLGSTVTLAGGGEMHSYMFASAIPCDTGDQSGTFSVAKALSGVTPGQMAGTSFTVNYTAQLPDGTTSTGTLALGADGTPVSPTDTFPYGTIVTVTEVAPDTSGLPPGYVWTGVTWSGPTTFAIDATHPAVSLVVTNAAAQEAADFTVTKTITGSGATVVPSGTEFGLEYTVNGGNPIALTVSPGAPATVTGLVPGDLIALHETTMPTVTGVDWGTPTWTVDGETVTPDADGNVTFTLAEGQSASIGLTNVATAVGSITLSKQMAGNAVDAVAGVTYTAIYTVNGGPEQTMSFQGGASETITDVPAGTVITAREGPLPDVPGVDWSTPAWTVNGVPLTPDSDGTVTFVVQGGETIGVILTNTANGFGWLEATKTVTGDGASAVPSDTVFTVLYHVDTGADITQLVQAGVPVVFSHVNTGITVFVKEGPMPDVPGVTWGTPVWMINGQTAQPDADGYVSFTAQTAQQITLGLANDAELAPTPTPTPTPTEGGGGVLPDTGSNDWGGLTWALGLLGAGIGLGAASGVLRRRAAARRG
ncbi:collagen-binding domain-containing protein [Rathayibacter sp. CAU 1779]